MHKFSGFSVKKVLKKHGLLLLFLIYISALSVPYIPHKKVSSAFKKQFADREFYSSSVGTERAAYLPDNTDALIYRLHMINSAKKEIILSTFDFNADKAGKDVMAALYHAADRGVKVRVIVDGFSGLLDMKLQSREWFQALASHKNIQVKVYNPINPLKPWDMQARLHDKYVIVDEQMYLLGGRNTMNLFLGDYSSSKNIDRELFVYETAHNPEASLFQVKTYFENIWALSDSKDFVCKKKTEKISDAEKQLKKRFGKLQELYPEAYTSWKYEERTFETNKISLLCNPLESENKEPWMWYALHQLMSEAEEVTIYTPYIICGKEMYQDLASLQEKNISVEIITNDVASGANPWGCTDYLNQQKNIRKTGVKVYEFMGKHSCHTKAVLLDDRMSILGSYNLDMRSTYQDTELMLAVDAPALNSMIRKEVETDKTYSKIMQENGEYQYGENYKAKEMTTGKKVFYGVLRVVILPLRRFL